VIKRTRWILALSLAMAAAAQAQNRPGEVVQATPSAAAVDSLNRNLALLSRNPRDVTALLGAGQAALDLGDIQAANGFYTRANLVNPNLGKAKLGLAIVQIALKQPAEASANFDAAQALGESAQGHLSERGLAYDLTGQQEKAQRDYLAALQADPNNEQARLRYATSLGVSGNVNEAENQLRVPLAAGDREAWRLRAFIFAMNGRMDDAQKVTQSVMPKGLADALDPYMQRLPLLTPAQKAAAAHYGEFPSDVLRLAAPDPARVRETQVAAREEPGRASRTSRNSRNTRTSKAETARTAAATTAARAAATPPAPARSEPAPVQPAPGTALAANTARATVQPTPQPSTVRQPVAQPTPPAPRPTQTATATTPVTRPAASTPPAAAPTSAAQGPSDPAGTPAAGFTPPPAPQASTPPPSLADALSALSVPEQERRNGAVVADMAAVARIQDQRRKQADAAAAKAKAEAEAKAKADAAKKAEAERKAKLAANPARIWVQIATGKNVDALAFDLRRLRRSYSDAIGDQTGWTAEWGATRRLLVGPFKKIDEARATVSKIAKAGGDAFVWQSDAGEDVTKIGGK